MSRNRLPDRRHALTETIEFEGRRWNVQIGFYPDGRPGEVFADGVKTGSSMEALIDDSCVMLSLLLQWGCPPADLYAHLAREGNDTASPAASLIGVLALKIAEVESVG